MDVPNHLLNPPAGGWSIREAAGLWAWICYATPPTAPDTPEVRRIRVQAQREIEAIASRVPGSTGVTVTPPKPMRERTNHLGGPDYDWWQLEPSPSPPQKTAPKIVYPAWVTRAALEALCARRGVPFGSSPPRAAGAPVVAPHGPVVALATPRKPRAKPGPKPDPALQQAIEMALKLESEGLKPKPAALTAAEQFQVEFGTVYRRARQRRNGQ